ncbi:MAG: outer membrane lipoprotein carrier protein LolA [Bacteroidales bacterium]
MKYLPVFILAVFIPQISWSQYDQVIQDPAAGQVLERVAQKFSSMKSMQSDFELVITDRKENTRNTSAGNLVMKQKMYRLTSEGNTVYFNGITMWTYNTAGNEVTITEPVIQPGDFMGNPTSFFTSYKNDFKYRYLREAVKTGQTCHEIDLFPKNLNQPYSRIKVFVNKQTNLPVVISSIGKDGVDYTVTLNNLTLDKEIADTEFTFDPAKHRKVEVVDMRGLE